MIKPLPPEYADLNHVKGPRILIEALSQHGTIEIPGRMNNPVIMEWAKEVGGVTAEIYTGDEIPWCGLFMAVCAKRAKQKLPGTALRAVSWANYGQRVDRAMLGDVLVFMRDGGGHVGLYVGEDQECFHVLGGNQKDAVCITRISRARLMAVRRSIWAIAQPEDVRPIFRQSSGGISTNEK